MKIEIGHGVRKFDGPTLGGWYAWTKRPQKRTIEGPTRLFKWRARLDELRMLQQAKRRAQA